jgi:hypothetical protein
VRRFELMQRGLRTNPKVSESPAVGPRR